MHADSTFPPARVRAGGAVLSLIAGPLTVPILRAHLDEPLRLPDLRERIGGAAQTTLRGQVGNLRGIGALERHVRGGMPYTVENELTDVGRGVLDVAEVVEAWLARAPQGPIALGSEAAKGAIRALIGGWGSTMLRALAARPLSLTELSSVITDLSYPALERRLSAMRAARQVEVLPGEGAAGRPCTVTEWTRQAVGPLAVAGRCECRHMPETTDPLTRIDIEAAFLLSVPLVKLSEDQTGSCLFAVSTGTADNGEPDRNIAGVHVEVSGAAVSSCMSRLEQDPRTWALGTVESWLDAIIEGRLDRLRFGGEDARLAKAVLAGLHASLLPPASRPR
ncbi:MAG TPA: winged helix-turn-helix transcriptional regulator [Solirubrobacterales bacterium]|jgi:DNA-binding HxlR family transcriptional regulator|nr:winged helix-turn-helix transcriptional regulator [Solirubrobacterales bacterium]